VAPVAPLPPSPTSPPLAPAVPAVPPLVMIADDSKVVRVKTSRLLMQHGYRVVLAEDGQQAAMLLETEVPMALITDVEMPGMDGFELTRYVRLHPLAQHIPVFMITSADDRLQAEAEEAGVTRLLGKPYAEDVLLALVAQAVQAQPKRANGPA
jgi:CheY-like chemotaxis protein